MLLHYEDKVEGGKSLHGSSYIPWWDETTFARHFLTLLTRKGYIARLSISTKIWRNKSRKKLTESIFQWSQVEYENLKKDAH